MGKSKVKLLLFVAILIALSSCGKNQEPETIPSSPIDTKLDEEAYGSIDENGFVWRVAPTLAYEGVYYCSEAGEFDTENHSGNKLDPATGQIVSVCQTGHGGYDRNLLYDEKLNQFGFHGNDEGDEYFEMWPWHEFIHENPHYSSRLNVFQKVDSTKVIESRQLLEGSWRTTFDLRDAVSSEKCAVVFGITFLSDFVFELDRSYDVDSVYGHVSSYVAMKYDDMWGILDTNGSISVPFVFDAILLIDEETAFAKYNGKYGILDIEKTAMSLQRLIDGENDGSV